MHLLIHPSIIHPLIRFPSLLSIYSIIYTFTHPSTLSFLLSSIHLYSSTFPSTHPFILQSIHWFTHPPLPFHLSFCIYSSIQHLYPTINLSVHPTTILAIYPFIQPSVGPLMLLLSHSGTSTELLIVLRHVCACLPNG